MLASNSLSLVLELSNIHKVISQSLDFNVLKVKEYRQSGFSSVQELLGFIKFNRCLISMLCSHHQAEEMIAFPAYSKVLTSVPYDQFAAEHRRIETLLTLVPELLIDISGDAPDYGLRILGIIMNKIAKIWTVHSNLEEQYFSASALTPELLSQVQKDINRKVNQFSSERGSPLFWVVPFLLFNVDGVDQTSDEVDFTSLFTDQLVPAPLKGRRLTGLAA